MDSGSPSSIKNYRYDNGLNLHVKVNEFRELFPMVQGVGLQAEFPYPTELSSPLIHRIFVTDVLQTTRRPALLGFNVSENVWYFI